MSSFRESQNYQDEGAARQRKGRFPKLFSLSKFPKFPRFSRLAKEERWIFAALILLAVIFVGLMSLILISSFQRREIVAKYQAEQVFSEFLMQLRQDNTNLSRIIEESPILGLAIYDNRGRLLSRQFSIGSYPDSIDLSSDSSLTKGDIVYNRADNSIAFIRRAKITLTFPVFDISISPPQPGNADASVLDKSWENGYSRQNGVYGAEGADFGIRENGVVGFGAVSTSAPNSQQHSEDPLLHDSWNLLRPIYNGNAQIQETLRIPEVLYIKIDGSFYRSQWAISIIWYALAFLVIIGFEIGGWRMYRKNRKYRIRLAEQEQLARLGEAARTLTHEIKNPLSAMMLQTAVLKKTLPDEQKGDLRVMEEEIGRLDHLTKRISDFLRNPSGNPEIVVLADFLEDLVQRFDAPIAFSRAACPSTSVYIDRERFRSVMENLIKNAMESREDDEDPQTSLEVYLGSQKVSVFVLDRGDGLPQGDRSSLFDPFFTTKVHGSGIGLAISLRFIEAAGGTLKLKPREGGGTAAKLVLPVSEKSPGKKSGKHSDKRAKRRAERRAEKRAEKQAESQTEEHAEVSAEGRAKKAAEGDTAVRAKEGSEGSKK